MAERKTKVLLVEDVHVEALLLRKTLNQVAGSEFEVQHVTLLKDALAALNTSGIDAVLLDLSLPDSSGLNTFRAVRQAAPQIPIVVLSGTADENVALHAVREGAQDYLVKGQVEGPFLARSLRYAIERQKALGGQTKGKRGQIIAFIGAKGGVGTTTVVLNVAATLATGERTAIAAELRPSFGSFGLYTGNVPPIGLGKLLALPLDEIDALNLSKQLYRLPSGLSLLLAPQDIEEFGDLDAERQVALIEGLATLADYVIIDVPAYPPPATQAVLCRCDSIIVVMEWEPASIKSARLLLDLLNSWGVGGLVEGGVAVHRTALPLPIELGEITATTGCKLLVTLPPAAEALSAAQQAGRSVVNFLPNTPVAEVLRALAHRIAGTAAPKMDAWKIGA